MPEPIYSREQVDQWQQRMDQLAQQPRTSFSKKQVVIELFDSIEAALENRSYQEVAEALQADGLDISSGLLKQYINSHRREQTSGKNSRRPSASKVKKTETVSTSAQKATPLSEPKAVAKASNKSTRASTGKTAARTKTRSSRTRATAKSKTKA